MVQLRIFLKNDSTSVVDQIKALGFEQTSAKSKILTGSLPIEKLEALAQIADVKFLSTVRR
jgi:hypothetical protein